MESEIDRKLVACMEHLDEDELDKEMDGYTWESQWEYRFSPTARAYQLLKGLDLGDLERPSSKTAWREPLLLIEGGFHPSDDSRWCRRGTPSRPRCCRLD